MPYYAIFFDIFILIFQLLTLRNINNAVKIPPDTTNVVLVRFEVDHLL